MGLLAIEAGSRGLHLFVFLIAALTGEMSIGWSNDAFDARRDTAAGRMDKPVVSGAIAADPSRSPRWWPSERHLCSHTGSAW